MSIRIGIGLDNFASAGIDANATTIYNRIIADGGVSNLTRLNFFVKGLKAIYGDLANVPVCYDAHWIGYKLGSGTGATAGQAAAKLYSLTVAGDAVQSTAASQPLLLSHNGASTDNYWYSPRIVGNTISTPRTISTNYNAAFEIEAKVKFQDLTGTFNYPTIFSVGENYALGIGATNGQLFALFAGANTAQTTNTIASNFDGYVRLVRVGSSYTYYTSSDGVNWTLLEVVTGQTAPYVLTGTNTTIGNYGASDNRGQFNGNIYRVRLWINGNRSTGTLSFDFNPATYNAATSQTAWTSATGEVWTINTGTATTGYKGVLVDRTIVQGDGVDDSLQTTTQYLPIDKSFYAADKYFSSNLTASSGGIRVLNGNFGQNNSTSRRMWFNAGNNEIVASTANIATLNLNTGSVASGDTKFRVNTGADTTSTVVFVSIISREVNIFNTFTICNAQLNTLVITNQVDTNSQKTATYNLIRSINNNAF